MPRLERERPDSVVKHVSAACIATIDAGCWLGGGAVLAILT